MNRRGFLSAFLAIPASVRLARFQRPAPSELAAAGYYLYMSDMRPGQVTYDDLDRQLMAQCRGADGFIF